MLHLTLTVCPEVDCQAVAEVADEWVMASTEGPVVHVKTNCLFGHVRTQIAPQSPDPPLPPPGR